MERPHPLAVGAVVNPFAEDLDRELRLLRRKIAAGATFLQSQMIFDLEAPAKRSSRPPRSPRRRTVLRERRAAPQRADGRARSATPGCLLPDRAYRQISIGGGVALATELATELADTPGVDALHVYPLGAEDATREVASAFRSRRGAPAHRH